MKKEFHRTDHLANERTFLAWIRTNLGIMAFGFVIERFSFFMQQLAVYSGGKTPVIQGSSPIGIVIVAFGSLLNLFAFYRYKEKERQIESNTHRPSILLEMILALAIFLMGVVLIVYLIRS
jgi:putative membrane protein